MVKLKENNYKFWDNFARGYEKLKWRPISNEKLYKYKSREYKFLIEKYINSLNKKRVLKTDLFEEAFGEDYLIPYLSRESKSVLGIDISPYIVSKAQERMDKLVFRLHNYVVSDVRNLPLKPNSFNLIISTSTLDHFSNVQTALQEIYKILESGGKLVIGWHNKHNLYYRLSIYLCYFLRSCPIPYDKCYTFKNTKRILEDNNFKVDVAFPIFHVPFLIPTLINILTFFNMKFLDKLADIIIGLLEKFGGKFKILNFCSGHWIVFIARK